MMSDKEERTTFWIPQNKKFLVVIFIVDLMRNRLDRNITFAS